jgi:hypothetical protein
MNIKKMSVQEKKEVLRQFYLGEQDLIREVLDELSAEIKQSEFEMLDSDRSEIEKIIDDHFDQYESVFKALA